MLTTELLKARYETGSSALGKQRLRRSSSMIRKSLKCQFQELPIELYDLLLT